MERVLHIISKGKWRFAETMKSIPHWYVIRNRTCKEEDFLYFAQYIRDNGYQEKFYGKSFTYLNVNGYKYWTYGDPLNTPDGNPHTIILNRAEVHYDTMYDKVASSYDNIYTSPDYIKENKDIIEYINPKGSVLDVGCGTGLLLEYFSPKRYVGIDVSKGMLRALKRNHPKYSPFVVNTTVNDFHTLRKFDTITGMFGVGSYLTEDETEKLKGLLAPKGKLHLMYYKKEYFPVLYRINKWTPNFVDNSIPDKIEFNNHEIYTYEKNY